MKIKRIALKAMPAFLLSSGMFLAASCVQDPNYNLKSLDEVSTEMTLFSGGLELPLGQTEKILVDSLLSSDDMGALDSLLKKDAKGNCSISVDGDYNLDEVISDLHLEKLADINGSSFTTSVEYKIGDFDPNQFKIEGKDVKEEVTLVDFNLDDIPMPTFSADENVGAGMYKYLPEDMDIGSKVGKMDYAADILDISELSSKIPSIPGQEDTEISVQTALETLGKTSISISHQQKVENSLDLGENASQIYDIDNFALKTGGALNVELSLVNCPLTNGSITPDLDLDLSTMFNLSKQDLSSLVLNKSNGWKASKSISLSKLASGFPEYSNGKLSINGQMDLTGDILISDAKSTYNTVKNLSTKIMQLKAVVSLDGVVLSSMDITLGTGVSCKLDDVDMPLTVTYDLPEGVSAVNTVYFKEDKKMSLSISASNLTNLKTSSGKHISVKPSVEITFPKGIDVKEAPDGKITIKDLDLYSGDIDKQFTLVSFTPTNTGGKLSFNGNVTATVKADISGSFNSKALPTDKANDVVISAKINCTPAIKDYEATLDMTKIARTIDESEEFSFEIEGLDDFGSFKIAPKNNPKATILFDIPKTTELKVMADDLIIALPSMMVVDGSAYSGFDAVKNTLTLNGELPSSIELPVTHLAVTPTKDAQGKTVIKGTFAVSGNMTVSKSEITRTTFDELSSKKLKFSAAIPSMEAETITLDGDFNKSLDYEQKDIVILDKDALKDLPSEVKSIQELDLEKVNAIIEIALEGLPDMTGTFALKGTRIDLPSFLYAENDSHTLILDDEIVVQDGKTVTQKAELTKIKDVQLEGVSEIKGDVKLTSSLYSKKPSIDISTLKSTIKASVKIGVGNGSAAEHPGKIAISKAVVRAGYDMNETQSIVLGEIPAEFQAESVNLALNPQMHLNLSTNFGAPVSGDFVLTPYIGGKMQDAVTVNGIELPYSDVASKTKVNKYVIGSCVTPASDETLIATDLSPLLKRIPDSIVVAMNVGIDKTKDCIVYPSAKYTCNMDYAFEVPLSFGKDFNLNVSSDVAVEEDVASYIKMSGGKICLKGDYSNMLPVGIDCAISFLDKDDKVIEMTEAAALKILPSSDGKTASKNDFSLVISFKDVASVNVAKLRLNFKALASADVNLNAGQYIKLDNLKIQLPSGITVVEE